jgi:predicted nucleic acid-binding protein
VKRVVLDASAVMSFLEGRPGAEKVEQLFAGAIENKTELLMSIVNWGEVYYSVWQTKGRDLAETMLANLAQLPIELVSPDMELTKIAAQFRAENKLPYADCFAASLALHRKATLATADKDFIGVEKEIRILWVNAN